MKNLTSAEAILMLMVAVMLDLTGFIIFCLGTWFGLDDYGILEVIGVSIMGLWLFMRMGLGGDDPWEKVKEERAKIQEEMVGPTPKGKEAPLVAKGGKGRKWRSPRDIVKDKTWELTKKALKRFGLTFLIELIPFLGGFYPGWTIFVYKTLD